MAVPEIVASHGIIVPFPWPRLRDDRDVGRYGSPGGGRQKLDLRKEVRLGSLDGGVQRLDLRKESRLMAWV
jgi:hypothetical protein